MDPLLFTIREAAEALRVSRARIYQLVQRGELPSVKVGGSKTTRIRRSDIEAYAAELPVEQRAASV